MNFQFKQFSSLARFLRSDHISYQEPITWSYLFPNSYPPPHPYPHPHPHLYPNPTPNPHQCSFLNSCRCQKMTNKCWLKYKNSLTSLSMFVDLANSSCLMLWASCIWVCIFWSFVFCCQKKKKKKRKRKYTPSLKGYASLLDVLSAIVCQLYLIILTERRVYLIL